MLRNWQEQTSRIPNNRAYILHNMYERKQNNHGSQKTFSNIELPFTLHRIGQFSQFLPIFGRLYGHIYKILKRIRGPSSAILNVKFFGIFGNFLQKSRAN